MAQSYCCSGNGDCASAWLDELLCEYVDGTMDRVVRKAFDECLRGDHVLAQQVERLRSTRWLLCQHRCRAPRDLCARVRQRLELEMLCAEAEPRPAVGPGAYMAASSIIAAVLMAGIIAGANWFAPANVAEGPLPEFFSEQSVHMTPVAMQPPGGLLFPVGASTAMLSPIGVERPGDLEGAARK